MELRTYETIFVLDPQMDQSKIDDFVNKIVGMITDSNGEIIKKDYWGKRRLAYEIKRKQYGFYVYLLYRSDGKIIEPIEREFKLNDHVLRYLTVRLNKAALRQLERELRKQRASEPQPQPKEKAKPAADAKVAEKKEEAEEKKEEKVEQEPVSSEKQEKETESAEQS